MWKYGFLTLFLLFCLCLSATEKKDFEKAVREAVSWQMQTYPKSTLKDLYKNFFQDKFRVPYNIFFDAFVRSVNGVRPITVADWQKEWQRIESIIRSMELSLPDYDADCKEIEDRLDRGEYVGHHSKVFEESYSPHYRIISRQIFEKKLRPLL